MMSAGGINRWAQAAQKDWGWGPGVEKMCTVRNLLWELGWEMGAGNSWGEVCQGKHKVNLPRKTGEIVPKRGKRPTGAEGTGRAGVVAYGRVSSGERGGRAVLPRALRAEGELSIR